MEIKQYEVHVQNITENFPTLEVSFKIGVLKQKLTVEAQLENMSAEKIK